MGNCYVSVGVKECGEIRWDELDKTGGWGMMRYDGMV